MTKIGFLSDTHNFRSKDWGLEPCDIIVHSGDFSFQGSIPEISKFLQDAKTATKITGAKHFVLVPGNHERGFEMNETLYKDEFRRAGITVLVHESVEIEGIKFFGTPYQPEFGNWAYNRNQIELTDLYEQIPEDTEILVTHCPPYGILDYSPLCGNVGSVELLLRIQQIKPKVSAFGHIHYSRSYRNITDTLFINCAILDDQYNLNKLHARMFIVEYDELSKKVIGIT